MKNLIAAIFLSISCFGVQTLACSANLECGAGCVAVAPPGGSANCYTNDGVATCIAYDDENNIVAEDTEVCPTGGSGGTGGTGGTGGGPQYCSLYWWLCDPWAY